jgi:mannose-6-phosphate isomerase-like protein (cupin superfamily)
MTEFATVALHDLAGRSGIVAPDGSEVTLLLDLPRGGMARFTLAAGDVSVAVSHRTVEEFWYFVAGRGEMWRRQGDRDEVMAVEAGTCLSIPVGTHFQFRAGPGGPLEAIGVTMPPWPGEGEVVFVEGRWAATVAAGPS